MAKKCILELKTPGSFTTYSELEGFLSLQLEAKAGSRDRTYLQCALEAKKAIARASNQSEKMRAVAVLGGVIRRWHHLLIIHVTAIALRNKPQSMTTVANWQRSLFNKSIATSSLKHLYASSGRTAKTKLQALSIDEEFAWKAEEFFKKHKDQLKEKLLFHSK